MCIRDRSGSGVSIVKVLWSSPGPLRKLTQNHPSTQMIRLDTLHLQGTTRQDADLLLFVVDQGLEPAFLDQLRLVLAVVGSNCWVKLENPFNEALVVVVEG